MSTRTDKLVKEARERFHRGEISSQELVRLVIEAHRLDSEREKLMKAIARILGTEYKEPSPQLK